MPKPLLGFITRFVAGWILVFALLAGVPAIERFAVEHTIASLGRVSSLCGIPFANAGTSLRIAGASVAIVPDCTPLMPVATFAIAVLAFPAAWRWRLAGLAAGAALLWLYNLARIFALVPVLLYRPRWFEFVHIYLWQTLTLVVVFGLFLLWLRLQRDAAPGAPDREDPSAVPAP